METLDTAIRLMLIGQIVLISLVLTARGPRAVSVPLVLLQISVAAYLIKTSPPLFGALLFAEAPLLFLAMASPFLVWVCANVLFEFERPPVWIMVLFPLATIAMCSIEIGTGRVPVLIRTASIVFSLFVVLHAIYSVGRGSLDDLSEHRRTFRFCFVACIAAVAAYVLILELLFVGQDVPSWVDPGNTLLIAAVYLLISVPLLTRPADLLPDERNVLGPAEPELDLAEREMHIALTKAMEGRAYARTGLTIRQLADELGWPEHQLRSLINTRLGFKNFSTFLNGYRIDEARHRLADPKEARVQILTIALDAGFASLPPFNRAFRDATEMTPSNYRREKLKPVDVVTHLRQG
ncbi:MAG: helix-turn-helix domain-containing protein [Gammaproteobacteria bacterium]|nr:helix-turn-helix domain-containing protein [Gammaproteobacteria bacterium]